MVRLVLQSDGEAVGGADFTMLPARITGGERRCGDAAGTAVTAEVFTIPLLAATSAASRTLVFYLEAPIVCTRVFFHFLRAYGGIPLLAPIISLF